MKQIAFKLQIFEGPLDLLMHLINKNKVSIYDIPISEITEQYMDYLQELEQFDIEVSSEFLVLAANLLYIKSRMLLPQQGEEEQEDPRLQLVERLAEYKRIGQAAQDFAALEFAGSHHFYKIRDYIEPLLIDESLKLVVPQHLEDAMNDTFRKMINRRPPTSKNFSGIVGREPVSVFSKVKQFLSKLKQSKKMKFLDLFRGIQTRDEAVAAFLAVLELAKMNRVRISDGSGPVELTMVKGKGGALDFGQHEINS